MSTWSVYPAGAGRGLQNRIWPASHRAAVTSLFRSTRKLASLFIALCLLLLAEELFAGIAQAQYYPPPGGGVASGVSSFNARTGAVTPATSDYTVSQLADFITVRTSATRITVANGTLLGSVTGGTVDIAAAVGAGTVKVYWNFDDGALHVYGDALDATKITASAAITVDPDNTAFESTYRHKLLWSWGVTADNYDVGGGTDEREIIGLAVTEVYSTNGIDISGLGPGLLNLVVSQNLVLDSIEIAALTTATNCSSATDPAACGSAPAGSVAVPAGVNPTLVVNTDAVTADSQILLMPDSSLGTKLGVTCNTTVPALTKISARTDATSFTIAITATVATDPVCYSYVIVN